MTRYRFRSGSELARLVVCSFTLAFFLFSVVGCEKESVTDPDHEGALSEEERIYATVYVDGSIGDDSYDGHYWTTMGGGVGPKKTIQAGIDITPKRRICYVAPGTYYEQITMADGVILMGAGADVTTIDIGGNRGDGIRIMECNTYQTVVCGFTIRNGSCYGDNAGIRIQHSSNVLIRNNVTRDGYQFDVKGTDLTTIDNNLCRDDFCEIQDDPEFVNATLDPNTWNYHLRSTSPAIDTGVSTAAPAKDLDGNSRPQGSAYDMGAYEYKP